MVRYLHLLPVECSLVELFGKAVWKWVSNLSSVNNDVTTLVIKIICSVVYNIKI